MTRAEPTTSTALTSLEWQALGAEGAITLLQAAIITYGISSLSSRW